QAIRHKFNVSLMVMDLDFFKKINDSHGHAGGDIVLSEMGALLNSSFREGDMVARFGGEEFIVLLNHCDAHFAMTKAEKLRKDVENLKPNNLPISVSIGVTTLDIGQQFDFEALFSAADQGVYLAKENGRNQVQFVQPGTD
ncbi:MAG: GGDEF domain-containing protein, partial [Gammaproteobacteria bacterium]|nr:GGDEF domain-containing protein [Gammaproteobacteria bacterium]MBT3724626.1 GGDEF domain-containing protein [Gammaproteobacteria bacterium]MBT4194139.1 GGDEF domain-containing protein [Gammaproteobacteria bacterium]MBT4861842.1 GGDEF domain-containing protein [Gammaproteobacteria bacterium]MBT6551510.1 GGDEF domain-containing protein [Gammaproteobacteria bacterium]